MNAIVIEHVKVSDLPEEWRAKLPASPETRVTVRIEEEAESSKAIQTETEDPLFGMWQDRDDMVDVEGYLRKLRAPRF